MIRDTLSLQEILIGFENTLKIDYKERDINKLIVSTRQKLENAFSVKFTTDLYELQVSNRLVGDSISILLGQITECMKSLSLLLCVSLFDKRYGDTLRDVNYLGFAPTNLIGALQYLQDITLYERRKEFFGTLTLSLNNLEMCSIKRLLVIATILESLGIKEGVALIAQYLYAGVSYD
jgi:hypothetical protein